MSHLRKCQFHAFTLVELLVTVSIIGLLTGLSTVGIQKAMASAQRTKAASGLRQWGTALQSYVSDNDGYAPGPLYYGVSIFYNTNDAGLLGTAFLPYTGVTTIRTGNQVLPFLEFAAEKKIRQKYRGQRPPVWVTFYDDAALGQSNTPISFKGTGFTAPPKKIATLEKPSATWFIRDVDSQSVNTGAVDQFMQSPTPWHRDVRLHLYFDGHVEARPRAESDKK